MAAEELYVDCPSCLQRRKTSRGHRLCNSCRNIKFKQQNKLRMRKARAEIKKRIKPLTRRETDVLNFLKTQGTTPRYDDIKASCGIKSYVQVNTIINSLRLKKKIGYASRRIWVLPDCKLKDENDDQNSNNC